MSGELRCGARTLSLARPLVMGVLNVTPDSFSDGGRFLDPNAALAQAERMHAEGAAIVDVGGESTRPGAAAVSPQEELDRVGPVIERVARITGLVVSIDTRRAVVMREALRLGAGMVNDVSALADPDALPLLAGSDAAVCLMHMQGEPATMQRDPRYGDVVAEVRAFLAARSAACLEGGISRDRLLLDPGFGFGKTLRHNLDLLRGLGRIRELGFPVLAGLSRKSMIGTLTGGRGPDERLPGSLVLGVLAVQRGAGILRAHDVAATVDALRVLEAVEGSTEGS